MRQYLDLIRHVLAVGSRKENRTGIDTLSTFGYYYEVDLREGFPLLTTKKMPWRSIVCELLWFLSGTNKQDFLERHGVTFWRPWYNKDGTVNAAYGPAWRRFEYPGYYESDSGLSCDDGPCTRYNDQIEWVVDELKAKPMRRDLVVSAWQPHIAQIPPTTKTYWAPCHCMFILNVQNAPATNDEDPWEAMDSSYQDTMLLGIVWAKTETEAYEKALAQFGPQYEKLPDGEQMDCLHVRRPMESRLAGYRKERPAMPPCKRLCLHLTQRSADSVLGVPFNIASYALLTHLLARFAGLEPGIFGHTLVDAHIYCAKPDGTKAEFDHTLGVKEQLRREPYPLPKLIISDKIKTLDDVEELLDPKVTTEEIMGNFILEGYKSHPKIEFKVAV